MSFDDDAGGHFLLVRPIAGWLRQAREAIAAMDACGVTNPLEFADKDYQQFCRLVEAWHALGQPVSAELMERAQMRPVDEYLA